MPAPWSIWDYVHSGLLPTLPGGRAGAGVEGRGKTGAHQGESWRDRERRRGPGMGKSPARIGTFNYSWLVVWNMIFIFVLFFHRLGIIIPTDELIFFRGVGRPPTR